MKTLKLRRGEALVHRGRQCVFWKALNLTEALVRDLEKDEDMVVRIVDLKLPTGDVKPASAPEAVESAESYSDEDIAEADRKLAMLKPLLTKPKDGSRPYDTIAKEAGVSVATLYRWRQSFIEKGSKSGLIAKKRGVKQGTKRLDPDVAVILDAVIARRHLSADRAGATAIREDVMLEIATAGLKKRVPHINTVRKRLRDIPELVRVKGQEGPLAAEQQFSENAGSLVADYPLEYVQVDHTLLKVVVVTDDHLRLPIGPAWITVVFDVYSRMVLGIYVSLDGPCAQSVGEGIANAVLPKEKWLERLGIDLTWPVWGKPTTLHADNASDFRCETVTKSCKLHDINIQWRPVAKPNWGGHIEAYMKALAKMFNDLPGALYKKSKSIENPNATKEAAMTLRELECYIVREIVGKYHETQHSGIRKMTPLARWKKGLFNPEKGLGLGLPERIVDEETFRIDFWPRFERTIGPNGVEIKNVTYYDPILNSHINEFEPGSRRLKRKFVFRRNDYNIQSIRFWDAQSKQYHPVAAADLTMPPANRWEWHKAVEQTRVPNVPVDEKRVIDTMMKNRALVASAEKATKKARREAARQKRTGEVTKPNPTSPPRPTAVPDGVANAVASIAPFDDVESG